MWNCRIIYALALTGAALFLVLYPLWFSSYLIVTLLFLVPLDFFVSLPGMLASPDISLTAPQVLQQGADEALVLSVICSSKYPVKGVKALIKLTGEDFSLKRKLFINFNSRDFDNRGRSGRYEMDIDTSYSGVTVFDVQRVGIVSLVGLFCLPIGILRAGGNYLHKISVLVLPPPIQPPVTNALPIGFALHPKPGGGFSDEHDLRLFRHGDTIRNVHWKVSAKLDSLIIREPLVSLSQSYLINVGKWDGARERDLILGRLLWVSENLIRRNQTHFVSFEDSESYAEVTRISDLHDYLRVVLDITADDDKYYVNAPMRCTWVYRVEGDN